MLYRKTARQNLRNSKKQSIQKQRELFQVQPNFAALKNFVKLGWESLQSRRKKDKLILLYKMLYGLASD